MDKEREASIYKASILGIFLNFLLFIFKLIIGISVSSISIITDAFNNISDTVSSIITMIGLKLAQAPADDEHPFGHERIEYLSGIFISFIVIGLGLSFFKSSFEKIINPVEIEITMFSMVVLITSILIKLFMYKYNLIVSQKTNSSALKATAIDAKGDVIITSCILISFIFHSLTGIHVDGVVGCFISAIIIKSGIELVKETINPLLGEAPPEELSNQIIDFVSKYEGVFGTHDLIVHNYGVNTCLASIHAEVSSKLSLLEVHEILDQIERDILDEIKIHLVIHADPLNENIEELEYAKTCIFKACNFAFTSNKLNFKNPMISNLRVVGHGVKLNVIFDVDINNISIDKDEVTKLRCDIEDKLKSINEHFNCSINFT